MKFILLIFAFIGFSLQAETSILFIGNSYTAQIRNTFKALTKHEKQAVYLGFSTPGGCTLAKHLKNPKTLELIKSRKWSYVILQEQSQTPAHPLLKKAFFSASKDLVKLIKAQDSTPIFYLTWGRRDGDTRNIKTSPDYLTMQNKLTESYTQIAKETESELAPVGIAWQALRESNPKSGLELYKKDGSHPAAAGAYLASLSIYCKVFKTSPEQVTFTAGLKAADIKSIKNAVQSSL